MAAEAGKRVSRVREVVELSSRIMSAVCGEDPYSFMAAVASDADGNITVTICGNALSLIIGAARLLADVHFHIEGGASPEATLAAFVEAYEKMVDELAPRYTAGRGEIGETAAEGAGEADGGGEAEGSGDDAAG